MTARITDNSNKDNEIMQLMSSHKKYCKCSYMLILNFLPQLVQSLLKLPTANCCSCTDK